MTVISGTYKDGRPKDLKQGCLIIGGMPIGRHQDISLRMLQEIQECDIVVAENKQFFITICKTYNLKHTDHIIQYGYNIDFNKIIKELIIHLKNNKKILLVSDCGMPTITDPGAEIVREAIKNNILITSIPGPNVAITALSLSGFSHNNFSYYGYLPKTNQEKEIVLKNAKNLNNISIFLDYQTRIDDTLKQIELIFGKYIPIFVGINMTMDNEFLIYGYPAYALEKIQEFIKIWKDIHIVLCINNVPENNIKEEHWTSLD
jgi:16S rRNA (cytidine1402-2'-O)-methyltransferase